MAVDDDNIKFSDLYTIITGTAHDGNQSISLSDFRGEGSVPTSGLISINSHFKGQTFSSGGGGDTLEDLKEIFTDAVLGQMYTALTGAGGTMYNINNDLRYGVNNIDDGSNDIYDRGNYIHFGSSGALTYTNDITTHQGNVKYFMKIGPSATNRFFIFFADVDSSISYVRIYGNNGADHQGSTQTGELTVTKGSTEYKVFWKSVDDGRTGDPAINHVWIVKNEGSLIRTFSSDTDNDEHKLQINSSIDRVYYILWCGERSDAHTNNTEVTAVVNSFLSNIGFDINDISIITDYGADDFAYINCSSVSNFNNKTFQEYISSFGITGSSTNNSSTQWDNGYSGLLNYDFRLSNYSKDYFKYTSNDYGLRFIHGDGSSDGPDWCVIDFGPLYNGDFDGRYQNTTGRYFGGENTASGGGAGFYTSSSNKGMLWGFNDNDGWKLLYQLPLGVRNNGYNKSNGKWFTTGGSLVTSGDGKRAEYDTMKLTAVGFSVASAITP